MHKCFESGLCAGLAYFSTGTSNFLESQKEYMKIDEGDTNYYFNYAQNN